LALRQNIILLGRQVSTEIMGGEHSYNDVNVVWGSGGGDETPVEQKELDHTARLGFAVEPGELGPEARAAIAALKSGKAGGNFLQGAVVESFCVLLIRRCSERWCDLVIFEQFDFEVEWVRVCL